MKKVGIGVVLLPLLILFGCAGKSVSPTLEELTENFANPPQEARPQVWWHWIDGNISKEGIREDLLWFQRIGLGGVHHFDAALSSPQVVDERVIYMDERWKDAFSYAVALSDSLGLPMTIASSPGWSCTGGPWVKPQQAMKKLVWREVPVIGGRELSIALPEPPRTTRRYQDIPLQSSVLENEAQLPEYYEDIAVLAVKVPSGEKTAAQLGGKLSIDGVSAEYSFPEPVTFCAVSLSDRRERSQWANVPADTSAVLSVSDDGVLFREVTRIPSTGVGRSTVNFNAASGRFFRVESSAGILSLELYTTPRVHHAEEKAAFAAPHDLADFPTMAVGDFASEAIDLTDCFDGKTLNWDAPEGDWKIYRFGWSLTGKMNHPAPKEATGLEVDKLDPIAWEAYFKEYFRMYKEASAGLFGSRGIQYILTDSYEAEQETWTPAMPEQFRSRRGYDLLPWLPALAGEVIGSAEATEKFLWDWRRTIGELIAENYDRLTDIALENGLKGRYTESHENGRVFVVDGMDVKRRATFPMAACWVPNPWGGSTLEMAQADIRESASVAHVYGQNIAAAESFTSVGVHGRAWTYDPRSLKYIADTELASGLNRFVIHESAHQPRNDNAPGIGLSVTGQWFNRHETWAEEAAAWVGYLARSSYMLQQGRNVADILVFYGEDTNVTAQFGTALPDIPAGYNYDFASPDVLLHQVSARKGKLATGSGQAYSALLLAGQQRYVSNETASRIASFEKAGIRVCRSLEELRNVLGEPDYIGPEGTRYVHRTLPHAEIYWVNKPSRDTCTITASFRVSGLVPQIWHPEDGRMHGAVYRDVNGRTEVDIPMVADDAVFVVFCHSERSEETVTLSEETTIQSPWRVTFEEGRGAPSEAVFTALTDWTESSDPGIRHFSGTAVYHNTFRIENLPERLILDLGRVDNIAHVYVNGKDCGTLWKEPYTADITSAAREGENELEIAVTNLWPNRLIGDLQPDCPSPVAHPYMNFFTPSSPLLPSGLKGPVSIRFVP